MNDVAIYDASGHLNDLISESMGRETGGILPPIHAGDEGDVLTVTDGVASWEPVPEELPTPEEGDAGKVLTLDSELDPVWSTPEKELPAGEAGDASKVLTLNAELEPTWALIPRQLPDVAIPEDSGKVLTVGESSIVWAQPSGGDLYWHTVTLSTNNQYLGVCSLVILNTSSNDIILQDIFDIMDAGGIITLNSAFGSDGTNVVYPMFLQKGASFYEVVYRANDGRLLTASIASSGFSINSNYTSTHKIM